MRIIRTLLHDCAWENMMLRIMFQYICRGNRMAAPLHSSIACASLYKKLVLWHGASQHKISHAMEPQELFDET